LLQVFLRDFGTVLERYITDIVDTENPKLLISTNYATYKISIIDGEENKVDNKTIDIGRDALDKDLNKIKYFIRRQFIADEELSNLYLRRGSDIKPHEVQEGALNSLAAARDDNLKRALVVFATGLGKTILSALDVKMFDAKKVLFIVHINEILRQTKDAFEKVMPERRDDFGFFTGKQKDRQKDILFTSIQTIGRQKHIETFPPSYFDYIIVDETHHVAAPTYRKIFEYFTPKFFLGLTATPDRMDKKDILSFYNENVVFEMDQKAAIEQGYLTPFRYLGFKDNIDYSDIYFNGFKYDTKDLNKHLLINERDDAIIEKFKLHAFDRKTIGFCASIEHAERCAKKFNEAGIKSIAIHSKSLELDDYEDKTKGSLVDHFRNNRCQIAFTVDMFNEGVDIPDVSCLLFLRPTESKTIFVQHMGRGLRIAPSKENVIILDFIGNYRTANLILEALDIENNIRGLKKTCVDNKDMFIYEINGCEVCFESEVVDIFKNNEVLYSKEIREDVVDIRWKEYSEYLDKWTKDNLYWKCGQHNKYFEVHFEALKIIKENKGIGEKDFIEKIQKVVTEKYVNKNMTAGFRALMLSKICGFVSSDSPLMPMQPYDVIYKITKDFSDLRKYEDILTQQLEKIFYWNPIYGSYNKYVDLTKRVSFKDFKIYPFFLIYDVMIRLLDDYGSEPCISKFEFDTFLSITKEHIESRDVAEKILRYRNDDEKKQVEKLLNSKNHIDSRFFGILHYCKYIKTDKRGVSIKPECIEEIRLRVGKFRGLYESGKLIMYSTESPKTYKDMLYSEGDLLSFHVN
jgi:superfamily II DNA or RNA helicase